MSARSKARKRALDAIFQADLNEVAIATQSLGEEEIDQDYANTIIEGVKQNLVKIDEMISSSLKNWTIDRIPRVDRNILRLAVYELLFQKDLPINMGKGTRSLHHCSFPLCLSLHLYFIRRNR